MKFIHTADAQLGYTQYGLKTREDDFEAAFRFMVDFAIKDGVDAVLLAGDQFEFVKPTGRTVNFMKASVDRLRREGISVLGIEGNHDASNGHWLAVCGISDIHADIVTVAGVNFSGLHYDRDGTMMDRTKVLLEEVKDDIDVFAMHQTILEAAPFTPLSGLELAKLLKPRGVKYVAMGHLHTYGTYNLNDIVFTYPGSLEMTDINEHRDKYFAVVELSGKNHNKLKSTMVKIPSRPIIHTVIDSKKAYDDLMALLAEHQTALVVLSVRKDKLQYLDKVKEYTKRLDIPLRASTFSKEVDPKVFKRDAVWERDKGVIDLRKTVGTDFPEDDDRFGLTIALLQNPDQIEEIVDAYIKEQDI